MDAIVAPDTKKTLTLVNYFDHDKVLFVAKPQHQQTMANRLSFVVTGG